MMGRESVCDYGKLQEVNIVTQNPHENLGLLSPGRGKYARHEFRQ